MGAPSAFQKIRGEGQPSRVQDNVGRTLDPLAERVGNTPIMGAPPPSWIRPDIISTSSFAQVTRTSSSPVPLTSYQKDALGYVHGKVAISTAAGTLGNVVAFKFDKGYRPADLLQFVMSNNAGAMRDVTINPSGDFTVITVLGAGATVFGTFTYLAEE